MATEQLGVYKPAFLNIKINRKLNFSNIRKLKRSARALYFHEYIHFIQDIGTTFGLTNMWNVYNRVQEIVSKVGMEKDPITIPIDKSIVSRQFDIFNAMIAINGDYRIGYPYGDNGDFEVIGAELYNDPNIDKAFPGENIFALKIELKNKNEQTLKYKLGVDAISESMAYYIEKKFYKKSKGNEFPYCAVERIASFLCPKIALNQEHLFALCDISLMNTYPGWAFYEILNAIKEANYNPESGMDLYRFALQVFAGKGWDVMQDFKHAKEKTLSIFSQIYAAGEFSDTKEWFETIVNEAYDFRINYLAFPLNLYNDKIYGPVWETVVARLGFPEVHNSLNKRWFSPPIALKHKEESIHPIFLLALWQLHDLFLKGTKKCLLLPYCSSSNQKSFVDEHCRTSPWEKVKGTKVCGFGALWITNKLDKKEIAK